MTTREQARATDSYFPVYAVTAGGTYLESESGGEIRVLVGDGEAMTLTADPYSDALPSQVFTGPLINGVGQCRNPTPDEDKRASLMWDRAAMWVWDCEGERLLVAYVTPEIYDAAEDAQEMDNGQRVDVVAGPDTDQAWVDEDESEGVVLVVVPWEDFE